MVKTTVVPAFIVVTLSAILSILPKMHIIVLMATVTGHGQFCCYCILFVTGGAGQISVGAF